MKRSISIGIAAACMATLTAQAQTLNVRQGQVTYAFTAQQAGTMTYADGGQTLTIGGKTFDLGYCNHGSPGFDPDRHFAFLRGGHGKVFILVANFSQDEADMRIVIPEEAVLFMGIKKTEAFALNVSVRPNGYIVLPV